MSDEELRKLDKEIRDQDQLLTGYQLENERLYEDLKQAQVKAKTAEAQMFKENQKLGQKFGRNFTIYPNTILIHSYNGYLESFPIVI